MYTIFLLFTDAACVPVNFMNVTVTVEGKQDIKQESLANANVKRATAVHV